MKKLLTFALLVPVVGLAVSVKNGTTKPEEEWKQKIEAIPDSLFQDVKQEDLLEDEVYVKLARDGWSSGEIRAVMDNYLKIYKPKVRGSGVYGRYAKQWLPTYGYTPGCDTLYQFVDTTYNANVVRAVRRASQMHDDNQFDNYYDAEEYSPEPRKNGILQPGIFRPLLHKPSSGRILWIVAHPEDSNKIMVVPDGCGIARTDDGGVHWKMITDRIPHREHRGYSYHSAIPVDPDNWDHVFAFMNGDNSVYETEDGGENWTRVENATHKNFRHGYAFKDSEGTLKFIGATRNDNNYWNSHVWISDDKGVTWDDIALTDDQKDVNPANTSVSGAWFQEFAFDPNDRDKIYIPTSRSIFYFDDGARYTEVDGKRVYNLKKMEFTVWDPDSTEERCSGCNFPFKGNTKAFLNVNPNNPLEMWFSTSARNNSEVGDNAVIYRSRDGGKNWITICEPTAGYGSGRIYGNETAWGWLGGFGVNYKDPNYVYGCTMSSGYSTNGGVTCQEYSWGTRMTSLQDDGNYYYVTNSRHNADNHVITSHKSGRVFRGSDGGMLMIDQDVNGGKWTNIGGDMGQMLYYVIRTNEFGDMVVVGNTQDIDVQTYRDGRWGHWRGYEGSTAMINPYSGACYYSGSGGNGISGLSYSSWNPFYTAADVNTGNWYVSQYTGSGSNYKLYKVRDIGKTAERLPLFNSDGSEQTINSYVLSRDGEEPGQSTLWVRNGDKFRYTHDDFETTATLMNFNGISNVYAFAADPDNWEQLYIANKEGTQSKVRLVNMIDQTIVEDLTYDLPEQMNCTQLLLHEGSGDVYFYSDAVGIYLLEKGSTHWRYWTKGYNLAKSKGVEINYATQEMFLCDYGRGVYGADLQNPADRYFSDGFPLKELSNIAGRKTLGIDTYWTIPLYYNYKWIVNGQDVNNPYQYLTSKLNVGDKVQLELSLRENPVVKTLSAEYTVTETEATTPEYKPGKALYSNGKGRVDLGNVDLFLNDFTIDLWVKPTSNTGVILANGQRTQTRGGRGWWLGLNNGTLQFNYSPANRFQLPTYETSYTQEETLSAGSLSLGKWSHIAITEQRNGEIVIYVNGVKKTSSVRILPNYPLNNSVTLSLFADGYEESQLEATVDELKIWNYAMDQDDVRKSMLSHNSSNTDGLVYYNDFNNDTMETDLEQFSRKAPMSRILAETTAKDAEVQVCADYSALSELTTSSKFVDGDLELMTITRSTGSDETTADEATTGNADATPIEMAVYGYTRDILADNSANLAADRYITAPISYTLYAFSDYDENEKVTLTFPGEGMNSGSKYRVYVAPLDKKVSYWKCLGEAKLQADGTRKLENVKLEDLVGQRIILACVNKGIEIEPDESTISDDGYIELYDTYTFVPFEATIYGDVTVSNQGYEVVTSSEYITSEKQLYFMNGVASGTLRINSRLLENYGDEIEITLKGNDDNLIPCTLRLKNRKLPDEIGDGIQVTNGGLYVGTAEQFESLNNSNNMTFMTWVRFDNNSFMSGTKGVIMFRNDTDSHATGLHIQAGNVRCHWNEESWSWSKATDLNLTNDDVGRWIHLAMVVYPTGVDFYLDGKKTSISYTMNKVAMSARMMLGQTKFNQNWFTGAFDQTMIWNRSLSQDEVLEYMQHGPKLNDKSLIAYLNMDMFDDEERPLEIIKEGEITLGLGSMETHRHTDIPYVPDVTYNYSSSNMPDDAVWKISVNGVIPTYRVAHFSSYSYNFAATDGENIDSRPIAKESFTVVWPEGVTVPTDSEVKFAYQNTVIQEGEELQLALRPLGTTTPFETYVDATATEAGKVEFIVPTSIMSRALEMMVLTKSTSATAVKAMLVLNDSENRDADRYYLRENETEIPISIKLIEGTESEPLEIYLGEPDYASSDKTSVDPTEDGASFNVKIDLDKIDKKAWNPVTIHLLGSSTEPLTLNVGLEPRVKLSIDNDDSTILATEAISTVPVKAELLQGVLDEDVKLEIVADVPGMINGATGTLLTNLTTSSPSLEYTAGNDQMENGWNLIGSPYLADINLTKHQNYEAENIARYFYSYDPNRRNYIVADMNTYEGSKTIVPFSAYFIQAKDTDASFAVTSNAKSQKLNRKVYDYDNASEQNAVTLLLYSGDTLMDETKVLLEDGATNSPIIDEDAIKMWSIDPTAEHIYTLSQNTPLAINTLPMVSSTVPVVVKVTTPGKKSIRIDGITGVLAEYEVVLYDKLTDTSEILSSDSNYEFTVENAGTISDRFELRLTMPISMLESVKTGYKVHVEDNYCEVSGLMGNAVIRICDMLGRTVVSERSAAPTYKAYLPFGYYVVEVIENGKNYTTKIAVK